MRDSEKLIARLKQQVAIHRKISSDKLGKGYWGLTKEPDQKFTHEEILFLFARVFSLIGFDSIKHIRTNYPDVIAIQDDLKKNIEIETTLSSFKHHISQNDDLSICDYVLCWNDDLDRIDDLREILRDNNIEVIELEKFYEITKKKEPRMRPVVYTQKDIERLADGQLKLLSAFVTSEKTVLTRNELKEMLGNPGKALGGWIGSFTAQSRTKEWLIRKAPWGYQFNEKYRTLVEKVLREFGYI